MNAPLTDWFPADVKPARDGVYLTRSYGFDHPGVYRKWSNGRWHFNGRTPEEAESARRVCHSQDKQWRGLAKDPNA